MSRLAMRRALHLAAVVVALAAILALATAGRPYDFCTYHAAGALAVAGSPGGAYDFDAINREHRDLHAHQGVRVGTFVYSPLFLLPAMALARLELATAVVVNQALLLLAAGALLFLLLERTRSPWLKALLWLVFVVSDPVRNQFIYQNWSLHLALFVAVAMVATLSGRRILAAVFWALAIHLKAYLGLFLLPLYLAGRRRLVAEIAVAGVVLLLVAMPWVGVDGVWAYADAMREQADAWTTYFFNQVSIQSTIARYEFQPGSWAAAKRPPSLPGLEWIFWLSLAGWAWLVVRLRDDLPRALALTVPYLLLFVPKVWDHTQILFFTLFLTGALVGRTKAMLLAYLGLSWAYFPLVQHLLVEAITGSGSAAAVHLMLLYYPVLNLLALGAVLAPQSSVPAERDADT